MDDHKLVTISFFGFKKKNEKDAIVVVFFL